MYTHAYKHVTHKTLTLTYSHKRSNTNGLENTNTQIDAYTHACTQTHAHTRSHTGTHRRTYKSTQIDSHRNTHKLTQTHIDPCMFLRVFLCMFVWVGFNAWGTYVYVFVCKCSCALMTP